MIPFNKPYLTGDELGFIDEAYRVGQLAGDGQFTRMCSEWLERRLGSKKVLLTHSCTAALEIAAMLLDINEGDEIIMPSYTFVSTANAFVREGAVPVFVDIRADTLNIDERLVEEAITEKTKAIVVVHYAGVACEMDVIMSVAKRHNVMVIEDAAQAILSEYKGRRLGSIGDLGCLSFHETKNIISGEGGALMINRPELCDRAEIIREKGTNRSSFFRGEVDKYTWVDVGSSYLPGETTAAFLWGQLIHADEIISRRMQVWNSLYSGLSGVQEMGITLPHLPGETIHNGHIFYMIFPEHEMRNLFLQATKARGLMSVFHYVPLHSSPGGRLYSKTAHGKDLTTTSRCASRLVRLPVWINLDISNSLRIISEALDELSISCH